MYHPPFVWSQKLSKKEENLEKSDGKWSNWFRYAQREPKPPVKKASVKSDNE